MDHRISLRILLHQLNNSYNKNEWEELNRPGDLNFAYFIAILTGALTQKCIKVAGKLIKHNPPEIKSGGCYKSAQEGSVKATSSCIAHGKT